LFTYIEQITGVAQIFGSLFPQFELCINIVRKCGRHFLRNSSGHPDAGAVFAKKKKGEHCLQFHNGKPSLD
jgi:hypothetical protein